MTTQRDDRQSPVHEAPTRRVGSTGITALAGLLLTGAAALLTVQACAQTPDAQAPAKDLGQQPLQQVTPQPQPVVEKPVQPQPQPQPFPQPEPQPQPQPEPQPQPKPQPEPPRPRPMPPT